MPKLYFRHGTMTSAKTLNLLAVAHNYRTQGKKVVVFKPRVDDRFAEHEVVSRAGLRCDADLILERDTILRPGDYDDIDCVLVDEAQFLSAHVIEQLRELARKLPVICYGLRTDFRTQLFEGSKRLLELADSIEEVKVTCQFCNRKAIFNMRIRDGVPTLDGEQVEIGGEERYAPVCYACWEQKLPGGVRTCGVERTRGAP